MRGLAALFGSTLLALWVAACLDRPEGTAAPCDGVVPEVFRPVYPGSDAAVSGVPYGWMIVVANPSEEPIELVAVPQGVRNVTWGPVAEAHWAAVNVREPLPADLEWAEARGRTIRPNETLLFLFSATGFEAQGNATAGYRLEWRSAGTPCKDAAFEDLWPVEVRAAGARVTPGDQVRTATVGVWGNGTAFYTNIEPLNADPLFPAGYDRDEFDGTPLPVYVYDEERSEQPVGSMDRCWFTTIRGYNALLQTQAEGSTNVRFLAPEEAYTYEGNEDFFLYGEPLVFLNTVVSHAGATGPADQAPDPQGACFDAAHAQRKVPPLPVP